MFFEMVERKWTAAKIVCLAGESNGRQSQDG